MFVRPGFLLERMANRTHLRKSGGVCIPELFVVEAIGLNRELGHGRSGLPSFLYGTRLISGPHDSLIIAGRLKLGRHRCSSVPFRLIFVLLSAIVAYSALCSRIVSSFVAFSILHELFSHRFQPFRVLGICLRFEMSSIIT